MRNTCKRIFIRRFTWMLRRKIPIRGRFFYLCDSSVLLYLNVCEWVYLYVSVIESTSRIWFIHCPHTYTHECRYDTYAQTCGCVALNLPRKFVVAWKFYSCQSVCGLKATYQQWKWIHSVDRLIRQYSVPSRRKRKYVALWLRCRVLCESVRKWVPSRIKIVRINAKMA